MSGTENETVKCDIDPRGGSWVTKCRGGRRRVEKRHTAPPHRGVTISLTFDVKARRSRVTRQNRDALLLPNRSGASEEPDGRWELALSGGGGVTVVF